MLLLWILGILLLLLLLLLLLRVGVLVDYADTLSLTLLAGPLRLRLLPRPEKKPKRKKKPKKEKAAAPQEAQPPRPGRKLPLTASDIRSALPYLWQALTGALKKTGQRIRLDPLTVSLVLGGEEDPAQAAQNYGRISAAVWTAMPRLEELLRIPDPYIHLDVDYQSGESRVQVQAGISFQIRDLLAIGFAFGLPVVKWLLRWKKEQKRRAQSAAPQDKQETAGTPEIQEKG